MSVAAKQTVVFNRLEKEAADLLVGHQVNLFRLEADIRAKINQLLTHMSSALSTKLMSADLTAFNKARMAKLIAESNKVVAATYQTAHDEMSKVLLGVAKLEYQQTIFSSLLETSLPTETTLKKLVTNSLIQGAPSADWWARQSGDVQFRFANIVRQGVAAGETREQIARKVLGAPGVPGLADISKANARALVNSSIATVTNEARLETYRENDDVISGVRQVSTLDGRTSPICIAYADGAWDLAGNPINGTTLPFAGGPPRHWNCRSVLVPIVDLEGVLGTGIPELATKAAEGGVVPGNLTMTEWLNSRTPAQLNAQLGKGKAELWKQGKITTAQLLDQSGNPMTLKQLEQAVVNGTAGTEAHAKAVAAAKEAAANATAKAAAQAALYAAEKAQAEATQLANELAELQARKNFQMQKVRNAKKAADEAAGAAKDAAADAAKYAAAEAAAAAKVAQEVASKGPMAALKAWQDKVKAEKAAGTWVKPPLSKKQLAWQEEQLFLKAAKKGDGLTPAEWMATSQGKKWAKENAGALKSMSKADQEFIASKVMPNFGLKVKVVVSGTTKAPPPNPVPFSTPAPKSVGVEFISAAAAGIPEKLFAEAQAWSLQKYGYKVQVPKGVWYPPGGLSGVTPEMLWKDLNKAYHKANEGFLVAQKAAAAAAEAAKHEEFYKSNPPVGRPADPRFKPMTHSEWSKLEDDFIQAFAGRHPNLRHYTNLEAEYLERYTGSAYQKYNTALRQWARTGQAPGPDLQRSLKIMEQALHKNGLPHDTMLYRGINAHEGFAAQVMKTANEPGGLQKLLGQSIKDAGFASTSVSESFSSSWGGGGLLLAIEAPKGTAGAFVQAISRHKSELEWLLPPGANFVVQRAEWVMRNGRRQLKLTVKLIPPTVKRG